MNEEQIKVAVSDTMSDFYNEVLKNRFDQIDQNITGIHHEISDLRLTSEALVKIVDYSRLQAKVIELESRIKKLERKKST
ncbi:MAG: hypothetical protein AAGA02_16965 [Bacteroidota bacterium]